MPTFSIVDAFDVIEHIRLCLVTRPIGFAICLARVFSDEKNLSIAALSQTFPERLIEQVTPWSAKGRGAVRAAARGPRALASVSGDAGQGEHDPYNARFGTTRGSLSTSPPFSSAGDGAIGWPN